MQVWKIRRAVGIGSKSQPHSILPTVDTFADAAGREGSRDGYFTKLR